MKENKIDKIEKVKRFLDNKGYFYDEKNGGQLVIDGVNLWSTTEKWYDPQTGEKGKGVNSFIKYIESK